MSVDIQLGMIGHHIPAYFVAHCITSAETTQLPAAYEEQWSQEPKNRIYILGPGALGTWIAHQLAGLPDPPRVTLLLHRVEALEKWKDVGQQLRVTRYGHMEARKNVDVQLISAHRDGGQSSGNPTLRIRHLIVTVKAPFTAKSLDRLKHRLDAKSTIVFLQNGQGIIDEVNEKVFPDPMTRPRYILGTVSHGLYRDEPFTVTLRGLGTITLSVQPNMTVEDWEEKPLEDLASAKENNINTWPPTARFLMRTITRAPLLQAAGADPWDGLSISLVKLAANAVINPLTAIFDCPNGELLHSVPASRLMHMLLSEISLVLRSLPEAKTIPFRDNLFSPRTLRSRVLDICKDTANNESSMLQDMRAGVQTEIDYINGWIVRRGEELGVKPTVNYAVMQIVKAKSIIASNTIEGALPLEFPRRTGVSSDPSWQARIKANTNAQSQDKPTA